MSQFVLDCSMTMAWCFDDESNTYTETVFSALADGAEAFVPTLWPYEVANALLIAERRNRITPAGAAEFPLRLDGFSITVEAGHANDASHIFKDIASLARQYELTSYDAAYLELALRKGLPLATLDEELKNAAESAGVPLAFKPHARERAPRLYKRRHQGQH